MKKHAIVHQHYWPEDEQGKNNDEHLKVLYMTNSAEEAKEQLEKFSELAAKARKNMEAAFNMLAGPSYRGPRLDQFFDEVSIKESTPGMRVDHNEVKHLEALAAATIEEIMAMVANAVN